MNKLDMTPLRPIRDSEYSTKMFALLIEMLVDAGKLEIKPLHTSFDKHPSGIYPASEGYCVELPRSPEFMEKTSRYDFVEFDRDILALADIVSIKFKEVKK